MLSNLSGELSIVNSTVGGTTKVTLAGAVGLAVDGVGVAVVTGVVRDELAIAGEVVDGGGVVVYEGAQAGTIATRIIAPIRLRNLSIFSPLRLI
jgi:hypothetical protein